MDQLLRRLRAIARIGIWGIADGQPSSPPRGGGGARFVGIGGVVGLMLLVCGFLLLAHDLRSAGRRDASRDLASTSHLLADHAGRLFEVVDIALRDAARRTSGLDWEAIARSGELQQGLRDLRDALPYVEDVWLNDAEGTLRLTSFAFPTPPSTVADRDAFHRAARGIEALQIGERIVGRVTGRSTFLLARGLAHPDGSFRGMVSVTADLAYFDGYWARTQLPLDARVSLVRAGTLDILAQYPPPRPDADFVAPPDALRSSVAASPAAGAFVFPEADGGRLAAYRRVSNLPIYVMVSVSDAAIASAWRARLGAYVPLATMAALALTALTFIALRQARSESLALADLVRSRAALRDANVALEARVAARTAALSASEAALRRLNDELETRVREEVVAREEAQARLGHAQRMEALGQLAGGVAHDINNVLQTVLGMAETIEDVADGNEEITFLARDVMEAAERGSSITQRLLVFARKGELRAEALDPVALLRGVQGMLARTLGSATSVRVSAEPSLPMLIADKRQLETVLVNLAANARDAMPGGGALLFSARAAEVDEDGAAPPFRPGRYVRLTVADTGEGMSREVLARATEPFFTTKEAGKGTGLGLAMAQGFAEQSGGGLTIESETGRGTSVHLWLPVASGPRSFASSAPAVVSRRGHQQRVLLVDDDGAVRAATARQLEKAGYQVVAVASGLAALALLATGEAADAMVVDASGIGMDGLALIRDARQMREGLPVVVLSGVTTDEVALATAGACSLLRKPGSSAQIAACLKALLNEQPAGMEVSGQA
ncbi:ATP-binding protein (plasmid) [Roseomonas sp. CCTCC AB2023176]|uniref:hybrid sensor histidine kinase/response regulator n=1 Tax=Roseomonas sp. CCTCC AB2023176 TaxID=3342640 RepID=UPI0035E104C0